MANPKIERSSCHLSFGHFATENNNFWIESCRSEYRSNKNFHSFVIELIIDIYKYTSSRGFESWMVERISHVWREIDRRTKGRNTTEHRNTLLFPRLIRFWQKGIRDEGRSRKNRSGSLSFSLSLFLLFLFYSIRASRVCNPTRKRRCSRATRVNARIILGEKSDW